MRKVLWIALAAALILFQTAFADSVAGKWSGTLTVEGTSYGATVRFKSGGALSATSRGVTLPGSYSVSGNSVKMRVWGYSITLKLREKGGKQYLSGASSAMDRDGTLSLSRKKPAGDGPEAAASPALDAAGAWTLASGGRLYALKLYKAGFAAWSEGPEGGDAETAFYAALRVSDGKLILSPLDGAADPLAAPGLASWWNEASGAYEIPYALADGVLTLEGVPGFSNAGEALDDKPADAAFRPYLNLRLGDEGQAVQWLQQRLIDLKYLAGEADGDFGAMTQAALKRFQGDNALVRDGVAGPDVMARLAP